MYSLEQENYLKTITDDLKARMEHNERRFTHSMGVADTAERLAELYGAGPFKARVAGILHDWEKNKTVAEVVDVVGKIPDHLGAGKDYELKGPTLHGYLAAHNLPKIYPWLTQDILQAIALHTTGADEMSDLDKVVFIADAIEPGREAKPDIEQLRSLVGKVTLDELYMRTFVQQVIYVKQKGQYLSPESLSLNDLYTKELKQL